MRLILLAVTALFTFACGGAASAPDVQIPRVTTEQLAAWIGEKSVTVIDNNREADYTASHIPGATNIRYNAITVATLPAKQKDARMAFYCTNDSCGASTKAASAARDLGFTNVFVYKPGIRGWEAAGQKTEKVEKAEEKKDS